MSLTKTIGEVGSYLRRTVPDLFNPVTSLVYRIYKVASAGANGNTISGSLTEISKSARVEPFTIISSDLMVGQDYMHDVLDSVLSVFSAYYLQAIALDTEIEGVKVGKYLDKFSPSRSADGTDVLDTAITGGVSTAFTLGLIDSKGSSSTEAFMHPYELEVDPPYLQTKNYFFSLPFRSNAITLEATAVSLDELTNRDKNILKKASRDAAKIAFSDYESTHKGNTDISQGDFETAFLTLGEKLYNKANPNFPKDADVFAKTNIFKDALLSNTSVISKYFEEGGKNKGVDEQPINESAFFSEFNSSIQEFNENPPSPRQPLEVPAAEETITPSNDNTEELSAAGETAANGAGKSNTNGQNAANASSAANNNQATATAANAASSNNAANNQGTATAANTANSNNQQSQQQVDEQRRRELYALKDEAYMRVGDHRIWEKDNKVDSAIKKYIQTKEFTDKIDKELKGFDSDTKDRIIQATIANMVTPLLSQDKSLGAKDNLKINPSLFDAALKSAMDRESLNGNTSPRNDLFNAYKLTDVYSKMRPDGLSKTAVDATNKKMFDKFLNMSDSERKEFFTAMSKNLDKEYKINDFSDVGKDIRYTPIYKESEINTYKEHADLLEASRKKIEDSLITLQATRDAGVRQDYERDREGKIIQDANGNSKLITRKMNNAELKQLDGLIETRKMQLNHQMGLIKNANDSIRYMASVNAQAKQNAMKVVQASQAKRIEEAIKNEYNQQTINDQGLQEIKDSSNQVVGKLLNVSINIQGRKVTIPVTVRLIAVPATPERVGSIMAGKSLDQSFGARWKRWRAGRIEFFKDLILCQDLIDEHKKRLMEDDGGVLMAIEKRKSAQTKASLANNELSIADATNIFIISREVEKIIEKTLGGKLSSAITRNKIFNQTYGMIIVVIDKAYERAVIYTRGVAMPSTFSFRELKNRARGNGGGSDAGIVELLKQLQVGNPISF